MSPKQLLALSALALIITVAIAASTQVPQATTSDSTSCPTVLANEAIIDMVAARVSEVTVAKIQTAKTHFDLLTPAPVEQNSSAAIRES